jgi:hypothetical protein
VNLKKKVLASQLGECIIWKTFTSVANKGSYDLDAYHSITTCAHVHPSCCSPGCPLWFLFLHLLLHVSAERWDFPPSANRQLQNVGVEDVFLFLGHFLCRWPPHHKQWEVAWSLPRRGRTQVKVTLRLTFSRSISRGVEPHLGPMPRYLLLFDTYGLVFVGHPLWREGRWPAWSFSGPSLLGLATILSCLRFETSLFVASYDAQDHSGGIRPCLHTGFVAELLADPRYIASRRIQRKHRFLYCCVLILCCRDVYRTVASRSGTIGNAACNTFSLIAWCHSVHDAFLCCVCTGHYLATEVLCLQILPWASTPHCSLLKAVCPQ